MAGFTNQPAAAQDNARLGTLTLLHQSFPGADLDRTLAIRKKLFSDPAHIEAVREGEALIAPIVEKLIVP